MVIEPACREEGHVAEAARIIVGDDGAVRHREHQVVVLGVLTVRVRELAELFSWDLIGHRQRVGARCGPARRGRSEPTLTLVPTPCRLGVLGSLRRPGARGGLNVESARHAKVYCEHLALVEMNEQVLGATVESHHQSSCEALGKAFRQGKAQVAAALVDADEPMATEYGFQTSAYRLDLGEFRHCRNQAPGFTFNPAAAMPATAVAAALSAGSPEIPTPPSSSPAFPVAISGRLRLAPTSAAKALRAVRAWRMATANAKLLLGEKRAWPRGFSELSGAAWASARYLTKSGQSVPHPR